VYKKDKKRETAPSAAHKCLLNEGKTGTRYWDICTGAQWGAPRDGWEKWCAFRCGDGRYLPVGLSKTMHATAKRFLFLQRLVVAMILSCRTSDGAVDKCTEILREHGLFSAAALACLSTDEIWAHIRSCGFETAMPRFIKAACQNMMKLGYLPQNGDELFRWLGWGYVIMWTGFNEAWGIPSDTHVMTMARAANLVSDTDTNETKVSKRLETMIVRGQRWYDTNQEFASLGQLLQTKSSDSGPTKVLVQALLKDSVTREFIKKVCRAGVYREKVVKLGIPELSGAKLGMP
jgi:endonuclease III